MGDKVRMRIWFGDGTASFVAGATSSQLFDAATWAGAVRAVCPWTGEIFRRLYGEWIGVGYERHGGRNSGLANIQAVEFYGQAKSV